MSESRVIYVTEEELRDKIAEILGQWPWFADHPIGCHAKCRRWDIQEEHGVLAGQDWDEYWATLFLLGED